jgi:hypothetical protein
MASAFHARLDNNGVSQPVEELRLGVLPAVVAKAKGSEEAPPFDEF